jgi:hypothetical protein
MVGPAAQRAGAAHLKAVMGLSERRACSIISADRTMVRYRSRRPPDTELRARLRELANERRRFGYRRLFILLRREGEQPGSTASIGSIGGRAYRPQAPRPPQGRGRPGADPSGS